MKNNIKIIYDKMNRYPKVFVNGEEISRFMSLSNYIYDDIFCWADIFFEIMDAELSEEYIIELTGHKYHFIALNNNVKKSEYCDKILFNEILYKISEEDKYNYIKELNKKYSLVNYEIDRNLKINTDDIDFLTGLRLKYISLSEDLYNYYIHIKENENNNIENKYQIILSDKEFVKKIKGVVYLYSKEENLQVLLDYLYKYHVWFPFLESIYEQLLKNRVSNKIQLEFEAYCSEEYRISVESLPNNLDSDEKLEIVYNYYPKCFEKPHLNIISSNEDVIAFEDGYLVSKKQGNSNIKIIDKNGKEYLSQRIEVTKHNYVKNISIILNQIEMSVGETMLFKCVVSPLDAEDANDLHYEVSDENVAIISNKNELLALSAGRVCVKVYTKRVCSKVYINVLPKPKEILVSSKSLKVYINSKVTIYSAIYPANASPIPQITWSTTDSKVITIMQNNSSQCTFVAKEKGKVQLICQTSGIALKKVIDIQVV